MTKTLEVIDPRAARIDGRTVPSGATRVKWLERKPVIQTLPSASSAMPSTSSRSSSRRLLARVRSSATSNAQVLSNVLLQ